METSEAIETRRSVHSYADEDVKRDEIRGILEEARWSPSSYNLQPWEFVVVDDDEGQEELRDAAYGQEHVTEAAAVVVVFGNLDRGAYAEEVFRDQAHKGYTPEGRTDELIEQMEDETNDGNEEWAVQSSTIAATAFMYAAWDRGIATCPMGGWEGEAVSEAVPRTDDDARIPGQGKRRMEPRPQVASLDGRRRHLRRSRRRRVSPLLFSRHLAGSVRNGPRAARADAKHRRRCGTTVASACTGEVSPFHRSLPVDPLPVNSLASRLGSQASSVGGGRGLTGRNPAASRKCSGTVSVPEPPLSGPSLARSHLSRGGGTFLVAEARVPLFLHVSSYAPAPYTVCGGPRKQNLAFN